MVNYNEPYETVTIDVEEQHQGPVMEKMGVRKAELTDMAPDGTGRIQNGLSLCQAVV